MASEKTKSRSKTRAKRRAVIIGGMRTPFVKAFKEFTRLDAIDLGVVAVAGLLDKLDFPRNEIDAMVWSGVILPSASPNVGREIALDLRLPATVEAHTVSQACVSSLRAIHQGVLAIEHGDADVVIAGGGDSTSNAEIQLPQKLVHAIAPLALGGKATPADYLAVLAQLWPITDMLPRPPKIAERTTGKTMGESCEEMARRGEISREAQDEFAARSHHRAAAAIESGRLGREIVPVDAPGGQRVHVDTMVRADTSVEKLARLRPVFAREGTLTAGNSSPLTDGAAAVLLMDEAKAKALGYTPLAAFRSWKYIGVDPRDQLLIGPALAMPIALDRAGMKLADIDLIDMHEAFAAQVLTVVKALQSDAFARQRLGRDGAVGEIDPDRLNVHGGSVSIGHPFGATGARMVTTVVNELHDTDKQTALLGACAAGGMGAGAVIERIG